MSALSSIRLYAKLIWRYPLAGKLPDLQGLGLVFFGVFGLIFLQGGIARAWESFDMFSFYMAHPWSKGLWEAKDAVDAAAASYGGIGMPAVFLALVAAISWRSRKNPNLLQFANQGQAAWITATQALALPAFGALPAIESGFRRCFEFARTSRDSGRGLASQFLRLAAGAVGVGAILLFSIAIVIALAFPFLIAVFLMASPDAHLTASALLGPLAICAALQSIPLALGMHGRLSEIVLGSRPGLREEWAMALARMGGLPISHAAAGVGGFASNAMRAAKASLIEEGERNGTLASHEKSELEALGLESSASPPAKRL